MSVFQVKVGLSAVIRVVFITEFLLMSVRADGSESEELDIKYVLIGGGIGLFLAAIFLITKFYIMRKQARDTCTENNTRRPSEPHLFLSRVSHSEPPSMSNEV